MKHLKSLCLETMTTLTGVGRVIFPTRHCNKKVAQRRTMRSLGVKVGLFIRGADILHFCITLQEGSRIGYTEA